MARPESIGRGDLHSALPVVVVGLWTVLLSAFVILGADLMWAVALGDAIRRDGAVPAGVPFASAPQVDWPNPVVLSQLALSAIHSLGWWALPAMQLGLVTTTLLLVLLDASRMGARPGRSAAIVSLVVVGCASPFVVTRFPSLSLVPFVTLALLLRRQEERPSRAVWLVPVLLALWGNLHGGVLVGGAVLGIWVLAGRSHGWLRRGLVGIASMAALLLTSAGMRTPEYYLGVLGNEAASRRTGLWAAPDLTNPLDVGMLLCGGVLVVLAVKVLCRWEWIVVAALAVATVSAARNGVWLLLFLAPVAAAGPGRSRSDSTVLGDVAPRDRAAHRAALLVTAILTAGIVVAVLATRSASLRPPGSELVESVRRTAGRMPVLAVEPAAETFAAAGITVWAANPVDAFTRDVQGSFVDFLVHCRVPDPDLTVAVVGDECVDQLTSAGWVARQRSNGLTLLNRTA